VSEKLFHEAQPSQGGLDKEEKEVTLVERTLVLIKPDGMEKRLAGTVIAAFEKHGLKIVAIKMAKARNKLLSQHYPDSMAATLGEKTKASYLKNGKKFTQDPTEFGMKVLKKLRKFVGSAPVVAMVLEGENAVAKVRSIIGGTEPATAGEGTIRQTYSDDSYEKADSQKRPIKNIVHASGTIDEAVNEIKIWFKDKELFEY
jgi:nucleoside-diphosphate kinase